MGIRLIGSALLPDWSGLSDRAFRVLIHMAYTAKDTATNGYAAATYWAGHEPLMIAVLGVDPDRMSDVERDTAARKIKRAIQELKDAGLVTLVSSASRGRTAVYRLTIDPSAKMQPVDNSRPSILDATERGTRSAPLSGHVAPPISGERGALGGRNGGRSAPPRGEHRGEQKRRGAIQDPTQPSAQLSGPAR